MIVKCIKYYSIDGKETDVECAVKKGDNYIVLAISCIFTSIGYVSYYIQSSNGIPHWADARQFEVVDSSLYSDWVIDVTFENEHKIIDLTPRLWKQNESWFIDELIDETPRAIELFLQERDKIIREIEDK